MEDQLVRILYKGAVPGGAAAHIAPGIHQLDKGHIVRLAHPGVVLAEGGCVVDDAGTVGGGDVVVRDHIMAPFAGFGAGGPGAGEQGLIIPAHQVAAGEHIQDLSPLAQYAFHQVPGQDEGLPILAGAAVFHVGVYAQAHVAGQRPGGGGPGQVIGILIRAAEADGGAGFLYILIALGYLVGGKSRAAAGAIGDDLMALIEQALFMDGLKGPPFGFDVIVVIGNIGIFHVGPEAYTVAHLFPFALVFPDGFLALLDKGGHPIGLDLLLAVQAQFFFHLQLHRKAMGIPARLAQHIVALHGAIAGNDVLDGTGEDMADMGLAIGGGGAIVEGIGGRAPTQLHALFKDTRLLPEGQGILFAACEIQGCGNLFVHDASPACGLFAPARIRAHGEPSRPA